MARPSIVLAVLLSALSAACQSFENTAIVRTVELGGSLVHVTTTYAAKALEPDTSVYTIALGDAEIEKTSWLDVKIKGQQQALEISHSIAVGSDIHLLDVALPKPLAVNSTVNLVLETVQTHATWPWPETAAQKDEQALKYRTDLFVISPYATHVQRTKIKAQSPRILSYTTPEDLSAFTDAETVTKSGATLTYGHYNNVPPSANEVFFAKTQKSLLIHYNHDYPLLEISKLKRSAEVSHWGANLNIQDEMVLHNAGPALKGHFSRLEHQSQTFYKRAAPHVIPGLTLHLPAGISNTYFYDLIGNVSTSRLRVAPSTQKSQRNLFSVLEMRPRYPLLGGWNYSFTLGWDAPLADSVSFDKATNKYLLEVPIMTLIPDAVVDEAELQVILPEGATDIEFFVPFPAISNTLSTHTTYLDTVGRPALTLNYRDLTDRHAQSIFAMPLTAHLRKPCVVAAAFLSLFAFALVARRIDLTIEQKVKKT
ncbi:oligosaccharyl transferase alpha subunit [Mucidula mucida]|nr:oligosaccharyl transferase alpha subunit [Mucidula mucida]